MPKVATPGPNKSCFNYPLCKYNAKRGGSATRVWDIFCEKCLSASTCSHAACENKAAPDGSTKSVKWSSHGHCVEHVADPAYSIDREWSRCMNWEIGCRRLSVKRGGGRCHACTQGFLPCANALAGCIHQVYNDKQKGGTLQSCRVNGVRCIFGAGQSNKRCSTSKCSNSRVTQNASKCLQCNAGCTPCVKDRCDRRSGDTTHPYCTFCPPDLDHVGPLLPAMCQRTAQSKSVGRWETQTIF